MIGRFLAGVSVGCFCFVCPIYVGEIASKEIRGALLSLFQINVNFGSLFILTLGYFVSMKTINIVCTVIPIIFGIIFSFLPESPSILLIKKREEEATKVMKFLRGNSYELNEIESIKVQSLSMLHCKKSFIEVLRVKSTQKALKIQLCLFFFFQMSAINVILFNSTKIFSIAGVDIDPGLSSIIIGLIALSSAFFASAFIDKFGRRILICSAYALVFCGLSGLGAFFTLQELNFNVDHLQWLPLTSLCVFMNAFNYGISPVTYTLLGEIFTAEAKKFAAPICQALNFFLTFVLGIIFPRLIVFGMGFVFMSFAVITFFGFIFVLVYVPETKGKTKDEIIKMLE